MWWVNPDVLSFGSFYFFFFYFTTFLGVSYSSRSFFDTMTWAPFLSSFYQSLLSAGLSSRMGWATFYSLFSSFFSAFSGLRLSQYSTKVLQRSIFWWWGLRLIYYSRSFWSFYFRSWACFLLSSSFLIFYSLLFCLYSYYCCLFFSASYFSFFFLYCSAFQALIFSFSSLTILI